MKEEILQKLLDWAQDLESFVGDQVPAVVTEIITWGLAYHSAWFILATTVTVLSAVFVSSVWKKANGGREAFIPIGIGMSVLLILGPIISLVNLFNGLKAYFAPRLYVLDYLAGLLSN